MSFVGCTQFSPQHMEKASGLSSLSLRETQTVRALETAEHVHFIHSEKRRDGL